VIVQSTPDRNPKNSARQKKKKRTGKKKRLKQEKKKKVCARKLPATAITGGQQKASGLKEKKKMGRGAKAQRNAKT